MSLLDPTALSPFGHIPDITVVQSKLKACLSCPLLSIQSCRVMSEVNIKAQKEERWSWLTEGPGVLLWQRHAHREGKGFVEVNSTLIVYLCSAVESASIRTVTWLLFALYSSILDLK